MLLLRLNDAFCRLLMIVAATWTFCLCFFILADIVFRAVDLPLQGTKEIVANSVVIIIFLQVGFAIRSGSMLRADFLVHMFGPMARKILALIGYALGAAFFLYLAKSGVTPAIRSWVNGEFDGEGALPVPVWPARWMIVVGSAIAGINYIILALIELAASADGDEGAGHV